MRFFRFKKLVSMETSKYLRSATGEVILVVIGILIALKDLPILILVHKFNKVFK
jgi:hypothetical protein